jgi:shikimate dehydrogenase
MILSGTAKLAGIFGWPISHSRSPRLHGYWLEQYGIDGAYLPLPVAPPDLAAAVRSLVNLGFRGVNVTLPHKEAALALCDRLSERAMRIGAVNTMVFSESGIDGDNTDGYGFIENLRERAPGWSASAGPAVVLGAGGAARAAIDSLQQAGARDIRLVNRTTARAESLAEAFGNPPAARVEVVAWGDWSTALSEAALLVNTTALGMSGQPPLAIDLAALPPAATVYDIVYVPLQTALLQAAAARGNGVVDGLGMLLHQARPGFAAWFGVEPQVTEALRSFVLEA